MSRATRELAEEFPWLKALVEGMMDNIPKPPAVVDSKLDALTPLEAKKIGASMAWLILTNTESDAAVDEWRVLFPSTKTLIERIPWFEHYVRALAKQKLKNADWGLKARVILGATLSILDMISDIFMIVIYLQDESTVGFAGVSIVSIVANMIIQLWIVVSGTDHFELSHD